MIAENEIRSKLGRYLSKEISLDQFEDWLAQRSWNMHLDSESAAQKLASAVELRLAEYSNGDMDERALRNELRPFVNRYTMRLTFGIPTPTIIEAPSNNVTATGPARGFQVAFPDQGIAPQVVTAVFGTEAE
jgi:hypothetical protein